LESKAELNRFIGKIRSNERFSFVRFSDGELEILQGSRLVLGKSGVIWSKGQSSFKYPAYDHKDFDPTKDKALMDAVTASAVHQSDEYFKGIPTKHNGDAQATALMITLNGGTAKNLTFADLWINSNYKTFLKEAFPILQSRPVTLVANYRTRPERISEQWSLIPIPDGAFQDHGQIVSDTLKKISLLPPGTIVLSSASSISNLIGHQVSVQKLDVTFIDIGTALHEQLGFTDSRRLYLSQVKPWRFSTLRYKLGYLASRGSRIKW